MATHCLNCDKGTELGDKFCSEECSEVYIPVEDIIIQDEPEPKQVPRVIPTTRMLPKEIEKAYIKEVDEIYKYYADLVDVHPHLIILGFPFFYKFVKEYLAIQETSNAWVDAKTTIKPDKHERTI